MGQALDAATGTRRLDFGLVALCFFIAGIETKQLSPTRLVGGCAAVRKLLHSPTIDAATPRAFALPRSLLVSSRSSPPSLRQLQSPPSQIAVRSKRSQNVVRTPKSVHPGCTATLIA